jgi:ELWxxDGT repeat protein
LKDIVPGWQGCSYYPTPDEILSVGNTVYFATKTTETGSGLWKTDGTPNHTEVVKAGCYAQHLTAVGSTVFFVSGADLWRTDGTAATTVFVRSGTPAPGEYSTPYYLTPVGNLLFFCVNYPPDFWVTDGTVGGDVPLKDLIMWDPVGTISMVALGNILVFTAAENIQGNYSNLELWRSDGTPEGTWMIKDINPGPNGSFPAQLTTIGTLIYFTANDGVHGVEPWVTDGTPGGTYMVRDIYEGSMSSDPADFGLLNGQVFCVARSIMQGRELWVIDTASPKIAQLNPASAVANSASGIALTVSGEFFESGAVVNWNGAAHPTTFLSGSQLSATIPASDLASTEDIRMVTVTVQNPDGRISNPAVFSILGAAVGNFASGLARAGEPASVSVPSSGNQPGLFANILNPDGPAVSVTVAQYVSNPTPGLVFDAGGGFVDLQVIGADDRDQVTATFCYPLSVTGPAEAALELLYFDGNNWVAVRSSGNTDPIKDTLDSPVAGGRFTVVFDASSTPPVTALSGTVFTFSAQILTLVQAPVAPIQSGASASVVVGVTPAGQPSLLLTINWGDGTASGPVNVTGSQVITAPHTYSAPGVYTVTITASDGSGVVANHVFKYVVVYDPLGGYVTGGGWVNSPLGAYTLDPTLAGKATFGFVAKYLKGAKVPTGNTEFQFKAGNLNFSSTAYQWLVVAGAKAQFKGWGTINRDGNYAFMLTAIDGQVNGGGGADRFRIKIWDEGSGVMIYDNQNGTDDTAGLVGNGTLLQGGSIVIQKP